MPASSITTQFLASPRQPAVPAGPMRAVSTPRRQPPWHVALWAFLVAAYRRHRSRQLLARMDGHMLKDIGVTFAEAEHEANKPFWTV